MPQMHTTTTDLKVVLRQGLGLCVHVDCESAVETGRRSMICATGQHHDLRKEP